MAEYLRKSNAMASAPAPTSDACRPPGAGPKHRKKSVLGDPVEFAITKTTEAIIMQVDETLDRQLDKVSDKLRDAGCHEPEKVARELSESRRAAIQAVLDATMHKALRELVATAMASVGCGNGRLGMSGPSAIGSSDAGSNSGPASGAGCAGLLIQHTKAAMEDISHQRRSSLGGNSVPRLSQGANQAQPSPAQNHSRKVSCDLFTASSSNRHHSTSKADRDSTANIGVEDPSFAKAKKKLGFSGESCSLGGAPTTFVSALSKGAKKVSRKASIFVGRAQLPDPEEFDKDLSSVTGSSPRSTKARRSTSFNLDHEDKAVLRAIQAGHSTRDAIGRARRTSDETSALAAAAAEATANVPVKPMTVGDSMLRRCSSLAEADPKSQGANRSGENGGRKSRQLSCDSLIANPGEGPRQKRSSDMSRMSISQGTIAQMLAEQLNNDKGANETTQIEEVQAPSDEATRRSERTERKAEKRHAVSDRRTQLLIKALNIFPMVEPLARVRLMWETILTFASSASLLVMPLAWAFPSWHGAAMITGFISCPVFAFTIFVKLHTAVPQHGMLNRNPITVAHCYLASSVFITDVLTAVAFPIQQYTSPHASLLYLLALRHVLTATTIYERAVKASHAHRRVLVLVILSLVLVHWVACIWAMLADPDKSLRANLRGIPQDSPDALMPESWLTLYSQQVHAPVQLTPWFTYLYAVYWTLATTTTIGFGDVLPANELEVGVICLTICISALLYSSLIAYMSNLILASDVNWTAHKQKVETIKSYMRHRKIPSHLQLRIEEYLDYLWTTQKGLDEGSITSMLPQTLQQQLSLFCNSRIISTVPLFANVPEHVCAAIVMQLQPRIFVPEDLIITQGDWADEMFLIFRGVVKLVELSEQEGYSIYLKDGDYFGEIAVLTGGKRMMSVRAVTYCHLYSLQQRLLERILQQYPECIDNLLFNMANTYDNFDEIKERIFLLAEQGS